MAVLHVETVGLVSVTCEIQSFRGMGRGLPEAEETRDGGAEDERAASVDMWSRETRTGAGGTRGGARERSCGGAECTKDTKTRDDTRGGGGGTGGKGGEEGGGGA